MGRIIDRVAPDVVATMHYAAAARIAALAAGVPHVGVSVYPHFSALAAGPTSFARAYQRAVAAVTPTEVLDRSGVGLVAWGVDPAGVLLHDPALLGPAAPAGSGTLVGFPYGDHIPGRPDDLAAVHAWLDADDRLAVLVTLGSFIGAVRNDIWDDVAAAVRAHGMRAVVVSARAQMLPAAFADADDLLTVGHLPLSQVLDRFVGVVHHGGLGTAIATLAAGRPAVVVPQAFDQPQVAALLGRAGAGIEADAGTLAAALGDLPGGAAAAGEVGRSLVPADVAARRAAEIIIRHAGGTDASPRRASRSET
jgi:hypothetical protein